MIISQIIERLEELKEAHGDVRVENAIYPDAASDKEVTWIEMFDSINIPDCGNCDRCADCDEGIV